MKSYLNKYFSYSNFKNFIINLSILFFVTIIFVNQIHLQLDGYKFKKIENENLYTKVENFELKANYSKNLASKDYYIALDRNCKITGELSDRHRVRWVKSFFLQNLFSASEKLNLIIPYYVNIFLHSFLIFLTIFVLNKIFSFNHKYTLLFLLYINFFFQGFLSEYSYSIFEMFFFSIALYASKNKNIILFIFTCALAVLNRESGFLILLSWLIFNRNYKELIIIYFVVSAIFVFLNLDILKCLMNPKFFIPFENQDGQTDIHDIFDINITSLLKLFILNFFIPFGLAFYFLFKTKKYNDVIIFLLVIYLLIFIFATPLHHVSLRIIILPLIFTAIYFYEIQKRKLKI